MVATSSGGTEMSLNLDSVEGKSHQPERFGFILRLWSLLRRGILGACREELQQ